MNLLDENFPEDQLPRLREWHIPFRHLGRDVAHRGIKDPEIIPLLHRLRRVTFFTLDEDFFRRTLRHPAYCLVWLDVRADDAAQMVRSFLRHPKFVRQADRLGMVIHAHYDCLNFWQGNQPKLKRVEWQG